MSGNSSATGGFLQPTNPVLSEVALTNALQETLVGITGLDPSMIRPRWQRIPPNMPPADAQWLSFGITSRSGKDYVAIRHFAGGPSRLTRWSGFELLVSAYGPEADTIVDTLRDGLAITQNLEALDRVGVKLLEVLDAVAVPDLINLGYIDHADLPIHFVRATDRDYNILDIASSDGLLTGDDGVTSPYHVP